MARLLAAGVLVTFLTHPAAANPLRLELLGRVEPECHISSTAAAVDVGDVTREGDVDLPFLLNCNVPFEYELSAEHGALAYAGEAPRTRGPFARSIPYTVELTVPLTDGNRSEIRFRCTGVRLTATGSCGRGDSGTAIATGATGRIRVHWAPSDLPLLAGRYEERLILTVRPRP